MPFRKVEAAPLTLRDRLLELIQNETERSKQGQTARIVIKVNSLEDPEIIQALYRASQAGVKVLLNVRGICCLRPGVAGVSENITVISVVDRFLEHARILYFRNGGTPRVFISSADWMPRNLDRRVELLVPVEDEACRDRLVGMLETFFADTAKAHQLMPDGSYRRVEPSPRKKAVRAQELLYRQVSDATHLAEQNRATEFEPRRPTE
jgi:polyphosphate kinase